MKKFIALLLLGLIVSCGSPMDEKYNEENFEEDIIEIKKELNSDDFKLLASSILKSKFRGDDIKDMKYSEILEKEKERVSNLEKERKRQKAIADKIAKEEAELLENMKKSVNVFCTKKGFVKLDYQSYITYKFAIENNSNKDVRAIKGTLSFNNLFDEQISLIRFVYDKGLKSGESVVWDAQTSYNQFDSDDKALVNKDLENLKVVWTPEKIIFEDGSVLSKE